MRFTLPSGWPAACVAAALILATAFGAEQKPSLVGATRDQVLSQYGEPRSVMVAAGREIMFFAKERVVLRDGVVVEVEPLPAEPAPRRAGATTPAPAPAAEPAASSSTASEPAAAATAPATTPPAAPAAAAPVAAATPPSQPVAASAEPAAAPPRTAETAPPREPEFAIKSVLPPGSTYSRLPVKKSESVTVAPSKPAAASAPVRATTAAPAPSPAPVEKTPASTQPREATREVPPATADREAVPATSPAILSTTPVADTPAATSSAATPPVPAAAVENAPAVQSEEPASAAPTKKAPARKTAPSDDLLLPEPAPAIFDRNSYVIAAIVIVVGVGFLWWRRRQRQLELDATAVSEHPFPGTATPAAVSSNVRFTAEHLANLDWKHFELLVAAYYEKTGVVAERTKTGPDSPVHIKISWKGESRPFALVQCIARPRGPVDTKPLEDLVTVLTAEDLRRGYIVTPGKFSVGARAFAEEKHLTLMSGDIILEKLNALPGSARAEVMQEVMGDDVTTPTCPKCDAKMVRSPDDPTKWHCPLHADVTHPAVR